MHAPDVWHQWQSPGVSAAAHMAGNVQALQLVIPGHGYFADWQLELMFRRRLLSHQRQSKFGLGPAVSQKVLAVVAAQFGFQQRGAETFMWMWLLLLLLLLCQQQSALVHVFSLGFLSPPGWQGNPLTPGWSVQVRTSGCSCSGFASTPPLPPLLLPPPPPLLLLLHPSKASGTTVKRVLQADEPCPPVFAP
jgi:hypothetical protein